jgi:uncharacterized Zn-finger protein
MKKRAVIVAISIILLLLICCVMSICFRHPRMGIEMLTAGSITCIIFTAIALLDKD